jgi:O-antigen ligase
MTITSAFGENWQRSWFGDWERSEGLLLLWLLFFAFIIIIKTIGKNTWIKLLKWSVNISAILSVLAFIQLMDLHILILPTADRASSTFGNAAFYATYALIHIGLALTIMTITKNKAKWWWLIVAGFNIIGLIASGTRGALLGLLAGALVLGLLSLVNKNIFGQATKKIRWGLVVLLIALIVISLRFFGLINNLPGPLARISEMSLSSTTAQTRLEMWQSGWQATLAKPFLGYGFENYQRVFEQLVQPRYFSFAGSEIWNTRAHNVLVDRLTDGGFLSLFLYLLIFVLLITKLIKDKDNFEQKTAVFIGATIVAYLAQNLFLFDSITSYIFFFFIIGLVSASTNTNSQLSYQSAGIKFATYFGSLVCAVILAIIINQQWQAGKELLSAVKQQESFNVQATQELYQDINKKTNRPGQAEKVLIDSLARTVSANGLEKFDRDQLKNYLQEIISNLEKYFNNDPQSAQVRFFYNRSLIILYQLNEDNATLDKLKQSLVINRQLSPNNLQIIWAQVVAAIQAEDWPAATEFCQQGIDLVPELPSGYWYLSIINFAQNNETAGFDYASQAIDRGYAVKQFENWNKFYEYYENKNDYNRMEKLLSAYLGYNPTDIDGYFALAVVLEKQNKFNEARRAVKQILEFSPATTDLVFQEIEKINSLEKYGNESTSTNEQLFDNLQAPLH